MVFKRFILSVLALLVCMAFSGPFAIAKTKQETHKKPQLAQLHYNNQVVPQGLPASVTKILKKNGIPEKNLSVYIRDINAEQPLLAHNIDVLRNPASTMKLVTTYAALKELGPNYSWRTEVWLRGSLDNGVLDGDVVLKGYGDPFLVYENFWKLLKTLRDKGLKQINGNLVIDQSYFDLPPYNPAAFDGKPFRVYNAPASALMFNFQSTRFLFAPKMAEQTPETSSTQKTKRKKTKAASLGSVEIKPLPPIANFQFKNKVTLVKGKCRKSHFRPKFSKDKSGTVQINGKYAAACKKDYILRVVSKPSEHVFNAFRSLWSDLGGTFSGNVKLGKVEAGDEIFHVYSSPTLGQQMRLINKWSNNVMTKQVFLTLGAREIAAPATWQKAQTAVLNTLKKNGINTQGIIIENGSGLSRNARISARQMGTLLENAFRDPLMPEFMASMALPGIDGTLVNRFRKDDMRGRSHLKTGTLDFVTAISGYMLNRQGKWLVVVIQHNGKKTGARRGEKIQNALLRWSFEQ